MCAEYLKHVQCEVCLSGWQQVVPWITAEDRAYSRAWIIGFNTHVRRELYDQRLLLINTQSNFKNLGFDTQNQTSIILASTQEIKMA